MGSRKGQFRNKADFATLTIVDDQFSGMGNNVEYVDPPYSLGRSSKSIVPADFGADYAKILDDDGMLNGSSMDHPLSALGPMNGFGLDILGLNVGEALSKTVASAETALKQAAATVVGDTASDILAKPQVQSALTEQAKTQAVQATAAQIQATASKVSDFITKNKTMVIAGAAGAVVLGVIYFKFMRKK